MGLIDRFQALFDKRAAERDPRTTLDDRPRPQGPVDNLAEKFRAATNRRDKVTLCRRMYGEDPRGKGILRKVARDVLKGGVRVSVPDNDAMEQSGNDLIARLELNERLADWFRLAMRDGDTFLEVGIDEDGLIREVSRKPTLEMHRNSNEFDRFDDPRRAFWWHGRPWAVDPPPDATWFSEWQIVHARWDHDEDERYGTPMFASATGPWKRINEGELDIAIRRKVRAGRRYLHVIEGASEDEIEAYRQRNRGILGDKFAAVADFFSNKKGTLETVEGDTNIGDIRDVRHHIATWWLDSPVPMALMGYAEDLNRDVLQEQTEEYHAALESLCGWVGKQLLQPLLERQWLLDGFWPDSYAHTFQWGTKKTISAATLNAIATALGNLKAAGLLSQETALWVLAQFLPGFDPDAELDRIAEELATAGLNVPAEVTQLGQAVRLSKMAAVIAAAGGAQQTDGLDPSAAVAKQAAEARGRRGPR